MKRFNNFTFGVVITLAIILCCKCYQIAQVDRVAENVIGSEVFTLALPLLLIRQKLKVEQRAKNKLKKKIHQQQATLNEQAEIINHLLAEKDNIQ